MDGLTIKTSSLFSPFSSGDFRWKVVASGDVNGDGKQDLIWEHSTGALSAWYLGGANGLTLSSPVSMGSSGDPTWHVRGAFGPAGAQRLLFEHDAYYLSYWQFNGITRTSANYLSPIAGGSPWRVQSPR